MGESFYDAGDDIEGDELGARGRRRRPANRSRAGLTRSFAGRTPLGGGDPLRDFLAPFPEGTFTSAAGGNVLALPQRPQKPFIGERMVIDFGRVGASATGLVRVTQLKVGVDPQFASNGNVPASCFAFNAVGTRLKLDGTLPGLEIDLETIVTPAPAAADTILQSAVLIGPSVS